MVKRTLISPKHLVFVGSCLALIFAFSGCGGGEKADSQKSDTGTPSKKTLSAEDVEKEVLITANDQMQFNLSEFTVPAGAVIKLTLDNIGTMPEASMGHNVVILNGSIDPQTFVEAAATQAANDYIPPMYEYQLVAHTEMTGGGETDSVIFRAPRNAGDYPFLCSFPGHFAAGMKGTMHVE